jgi:hypothetical protein
VPWREKEGMMQEPKTKVARVLVVGPLARLVAAFELKLRLAGDSPLSSVTQKRWLPTSAVGSKPSV